MHGASPQPRRMCHLPRDDQSRIGDLVKVIDPDTGHRVNEGESGELAIKGWSLFAG